jgi:hypothetical protein
MRNHVASASGSKVASTIIFASSDRRVAIRVTNRSAVLLGSVTDQPAKASDDSALTVNMLETAQRGSFIEVSSRRLNNCHDFLIRFGHLEAIRRESHPARPAPTRRSVPYVMCTYSIPPLGRF